MNYKKIITLGIGLCFAFGISSCGGNTTTEKTSTSSSNNANNESVQPSDNNTNSTDSISESTIAEKQYKRVNERGVPDENGNYIHFGYYPQTFVKDTSIIDKLSTIEKDEKTGYITYNDEQYAKAISNPYLYRTYVFSDNKTIIENDTEYYFKVEPIVWRILNPSAKEGETALLLSEKVLLNKRYAENSNEYAKSEIREWLTKEFYNAAFTANQKMIIQETIVDNSASTTSSEDNKYASEITTNDKVFLLSYADATNENYGFLSTEHASDTRIKRGTDFALAQGLEMSSSDKKSSYWWLRSPSSVFSDGAFRVKTDGIVAHEYVYFDNYGVAPSINIIL